MKKKFFTQLKQMNLKSTDKLLMHASMKAIGGDANTVIDTFIEYFNEGLFMMPAHTWKTINRENNHFDPKTEQACVGILSNVFLSHPKSIRTLHPTHSLVMSGKINPEWITAEARFHTPTPKEGLYGKLAEMDGYILLVGVGFERNTVIHAIEESMDIPNRFAKEPFKVTIQNGDEVIESFMYKHENIEFPHLSENFYRVLPSLDKLNLIEYHTLGNALVMKMRAKDLFNTIEFWLKKYPLLFDSNDPLWDLLDYLK